MQIRIPITSTDAMKNQKTKSPLKAKPLRNPGQSLDEKIEKPVKVTLQPWMLN